MKIECIIRIDCKMDKTDSNVFQKGLCQAIFEYIKNTNNTGFVYTSIQNGGAKLCSIR